MSFKILYVTATRKEADTIVRTNEMKLVTDVFDDFEINTLVTGVGSVSTAWALENWIRVNGRPDLAINGGIAGSYNDGLIAGDVVMPVSDCFADAGIEDGDNFYTLTEAGLTGADEFPYNDGFILANDIYSSKMKAILKPVRAITVNTATGSEVTKRKLKNKFNPDIETMEGATFFYICSRENIPFLALRSISNKVELRDKSKWNITLALNNLSEKLRDVILTLR
jgi:futalosine hydrolase